MLLTSDPRIYVRVYDAVRNDILTGVLGPGARVPSIAVLCRQYGGGRQTIAKALRMLEDDAWLVRYDGLGYYVAPEVTFSSCPQAQLWCVSWDLRRRACLSRLRTWVESGP